MVISTCKNISVQLDETSSFIKFGRKKIVTSIKESMLFVENELILLQSEIITLNRNVDNLNDEISIRNIRIERLEMNWTDLSTRLANKKIDIEKSNKECFLLNKTVASLNDEIQDLSFIIESKAESIHDLENTKQCLVSELDAKNLDVTNLKIALEELGTDLSKLKVESNLKDTAISDMKDKNDLLVNDIFEHQQIISLMEDKSVLLVSEIKTLKDQGASQASLNLKLEDDNKSLISDIKKNKDVFIDLKDKYTSVSTKYDLVSMILSAKKSENEELVKFKYIFKNDFMTFSNTVSSLHQEAEVVIALQDIENKLQLMTSFSGIYKKNVIAVGGGFSAGKSEFISSFFKDKKIRLPIGIKPVTAIPTYIISGEEHTIKGYSNQGAVINISADLYKKLSHDFVKSFSFNLKDIMPVMAIETPMTEYQHICFVDTPGYNPSNTDGFTNEDSDTSHQYLEQSNTLLWVIGLDSNGTISSSDLNFLESLSLEGKQLYVIANKADVKSSDDLDDILDTFEEVLDDYDIEYVGISAYSSIHKKEISYRKSSLFDFLKEEDKPVEAYKKISLDLNKIFDMYQNAINDEIKWTTDIQRNVKALELDLLQSGYELEDDKVNDRLHKIKYSFQTDHLKKQIKALKKVRVLMVDSVRNVFNSIH